MAEKRSALIVATSQYDDSRLAPLGGPGEDAEALQGVLSSAEIGGFDVQVALNSPHTDLRTTFEAFFSDRGRDDLLLVHFSGHGLKDDDGLLYLAARDTRIDRLMSTGVEAGWVNRLMTRCRSEKIALFLDCCFGGAFTTGLERRAGVDTAGVKETFTGTGRFVITASDAMQYSFESGQRVDGAEPEPSPFTSALVQGLRTGEADRNDDGYVSINELYDYLEDRVRQLSPNQTPTKSAFNQVGDWVIAQSIRAPTIRILPVSLQAQIKSDAAAERTAAAFLLRDLIRAADPRVGEAARKALEKLAGDDSKFVSETASRLFGEVGVDPADTDARPATGEAELPFKPIPTSALSPDAKAAISAMEATLTPSPFETRPPQAQPQPPASTPTASEPGHVKPTLESAIRADPRMPAAAAQLATGAGQAPADPRLEGITDPLKAMAARAAASDPTTAPPPTTPAPSPAPAEPRSAGPAAGGSTAPAGPTPAQSPAAKDALWGSAPAQSRPMAAPRTESGALWAPGAGPAPRTSAGSATASAATAPTAPSGSATAAAAKPARANPARPGRAAGRAAVGSIATGFLLSFWIGASEPWLIDEPTFYEGFGLFVSLFFIGATVLAALVEASFPAMRVPLGSAYRLAGGNRFLAAGTLGALFGLSVGIVAYVVTVSDRIGIWFDITLGIVVCSAIGFLLAEAIVGRREDARPAAGT